MKLIDILVEELPKRGGWPDGVQCVVQSIIDGEIYFYDKPYDASGAMKKFAWVYRLTKDEDTEMRKGGLFPVITRAQYEAALAAKNAPSVRQWKYTKGSEKDFVGAPDWATIAYEYIGQPFFTNGFGKGFDFIGPAGKKMERSSTVHNMHCHKITAQREPITEWNGEGLPPVGCDVEFYNNDRFDCRNSVPDDGTKVKIVAHDESPDGLQVAIFTWYSSGSGVGAEVCRAELFRPLRSEADKKRDAACRVISDILDENRDFQFDAKKIYDAIASGKIPGVKLDG